MGRASSTCESKPTISATSNASWTSGLAASAAATERAVDQGKAEPTVEIGEDGRVRPAFGALFHLLSADQHLETADERDALRRPRHRAHAIRAPACSGQ